MLQEKIATMVREQQAQMQLRQMEMQMTALQGQMNAVKQHYD